MKDKESLEEVVKKVFPTQKGLNTVDTDRIMLRRTIWLKGAKYVEERTFTEDDMRNAICTSFLLGVDRGNYSKELEDKLIEQFKKK